MHSAAASLLVALLGAVGAGSVVAQAPVMPTGGPWRSFAPPARDSAQGLWLFQRDRDPPTAWHQATRPGQVARARALPLDELRTLDDRTRFSSIETSHGLWLVGPSLMLIRPDGRRLTHAFDANEPMVAPLRDGSILVLGRNANEKTPIVRRIRFDAQSARLVVDVRAPLPGLPRRHGVALAMLRDGRVIAVGGHGPGKEAHLYDPSADTWTATGSMRHDRVHAAIAVLPDGRVVVAASDAYNQDEGGVSGHSAEWWDPQTGRWTLLPMLPLDFRIDAHNARGPSLAVLGDGSLVLAGGMHRGVAVLRPRGSGFEPAWRIEAQLDEQRTGAVVQALAGSQVAIAGGVFEAGNGCCATRAGLSLLTVPGALPAHGLGLRLRDSAIAVRGHTALVAGGHQMHSMGFGRLQYSALAEMVDLRTGQAVQIAPLPTPLSLARGRWIDDDRVLVKGVKAADGRSLRPGQNLSGHVPPGSGLLAIYSRRSNTWRSLHDPRLAHAELVDVAAPHAVLVGPRADAWRLHLDTLAVEALPRMARERSGGTARAWPDGRIVVAGGTVQAELVSVLDDACAAATCSERYVGFGNPAPSRRHEIHDPATRAWRHSAASRSAGTSAVVLNDGSVVKLGHVRDPAQRRASSDAQAAPERLLLTIEHSTPDGQRWSTLPRPAELSTDPPAGQPASCADQSCRLLLARDPADASRELLLLREGALTENAENPVDLRIWAFDTHQAGWTLLVQRPSTQLVAPLGLPPPLGRPGESLLGLTHDTPLLWRTGP